MQSSTALPAAIAGVLTYSQTFATVFNTDIRSSYRDSPTNISLTLTLMELTVGLEPTTCALQVRCAAIAPHQRRYAAQPALAEDIPLEFPKLSARRLLISH